MVTTTAVETEPRPGSIGPPLPGHRGAARRHTTGILRSRAIPASSSCAAPNVFAGYWNDPSATAAVLVDGWLHTGDIAVADADGWLTLVDRAKDVDHRLGLQRVPRRSRRRAAQPPRRRGCRGDRRAASAHRRDRRRVRRARVRVTRPTPSSCCATRAANSRATSCRRASKWSTSLPRTLAGKLVRALRISSSSASPSATTSSAAATGAARSRRRNDEARVDHHDPDRERDHERLVLTDDALQQSAARQHERAQRDERVAARERPGPGRAPPGEADRGVDARRRTRRPRRRRCPTPASTRGSTPKWSLPTGIPPVGQDHAVDRRGEHHADAIPVNRISPVRTRLPRARPQSR